MVFEIRRRLADRLFSQVIRMRDNYTCVRCKTKHEPKSRGLHTSHFYNRKRESTRFDFRNADSLCLACHLKWSHGDQRKAYNKFKMKQLGKLQYLDLYKTAITRPYAEGTYRRYVLETDAKIIKWARPIIIGHAPLTMPPAVAVVPPAVFST